MKQSFKSIIMLFLLALLIWQCTDVKDYSDPVDSLSPAKLTVTDIEPIHGGAWIYYALPAGENDLLGVRAEFSFDGEKVNSVFASAYMDSILIEGAPDTKEYTVKLYVMDNSKNSSEAVEKTFTPLSPPVEMICQSITVSPAWGGVLAKWDNPYNTDVAISLYIRDPEDNSWALNDTYYTKVSAQYAFRNLPIEKQELRFEVRDKWSHYAYTEKSEKPLFEEEMRARDANDNLIFQRYGYDDRTCMFRGDLTKALSDPWNNWGNLFDGDVISDTWFHHDPLYMTDYISGWPNPGQVIQPYYLTLDMVEPSVFSRMKYYIRGANPQTNNRGYKNSISVTGMEVWACNNPKAILDIGGGDLMENLNYWTDWSGVGSGDWRNDWTLLADWRLALPSGTTTERDYCVLTPEDLTYIGNGFDIEFNETGQPFRYLRFVLKEWNHGTHQIQLGEFKFFGSYIK